MVVPNVEYGEILTNREKVLADALWELLVIDGVLDPNVPVTVPHLIMAVETIKDNATA